MCWIIVQNQISERRGIWTATFMLTWSWGSEKGNWFALSAHAHRHSILRMEAMVGKRRRCRQAYQWVSTIWIRLDLCRTCGLNRTNSVHNASEWNCPYQIHQVQLLPPSCLRHELLRQHGSLLCGVVLAQSSGQDRTKYQLLRQVLWNKNKLNGQVKNEIILWTSLQHPLALGKKCTLKYFKLTFISEPILYFLFLYHINRRSYFKLRHELETAGTSNGQGKDKYNWFHFATELY